jgi:Uncharacterized conserved protein
VIDTSQPGSEDKLLEAALDAGADDVQTESGKSTVLSSPENFEAVKKGLVAAGFQPLSADVVMRPENRVQSARKLPNLARPDRLARRARRRARGVSQRCAVTARRDVTP